MKQDKWSEEYYNYWDRRKDYKIGEIKFIKDTIKHPHRRVFVDWVCKSKNIRSILEVGPGEMVEYQSISKRRPDIKYSIADISLLFINNCKEKYPKVDTYRVPLERLNSIEKDDFDCIYLASVLEHSPDVRIAIKNCVNIARTFHFVFFKWAWSGGMESKFYPTKNFYSSLFNIWKIIEEIKQYGIIDYTSVCMNNSGKLVPIEEFVKGKSGNHRDGNYLIIHGRRK
jgi:hypothetical protein